MAGSVPSVLCLHMDVCGLDFSSGSDMGHNSHLLCICLMQMNLKIFSLMGGREKNH